MKTSELTGNALNWAVNYAEGLGGILASVDYCGKWEHGGPIIEREWIGLLCVSDTLWEADISDGVRNYIEFSESGPTPLVAAMRVFVASHFGKEIDVPEGL